MRPCGSEVTTHPLPPTAPTCRAVRDVLLLPELGRQQRDGRAQRRRGPRHDRARLDRRPGAGAARAGRHLPGQRRGAGRRALAAVGPGRLRRAGLEALFAERGGRGRRAGGALGAGHEGGHVQPHLHAAGRAGLEAVVEVHSAAGVGRRPRRPRAEDPAGGEAAEGGEGCGAGGDGWFEGGGRQASSRRGARGEERAAQQWWAGAAAAAARSRGLTAGRALT